MPGPPRPGISSSPFSLAIHQLSLFHGWARQMPRSVPKNDPFSEHTRHASSDLPCQGPFSWKVLPFSQGPSMPEAVFLEGPAFSTGTFHARGRFPGRCCGTDRVSDPTLLRFFKSMISGPRRVWGIRPPVSRRYFLCLGRELKYWWLSCILGGYRTICLSSG